MLGFRLGSISPSYPPLITNSTISFLPGAERNNELPLLCTPPINCEKLQCPLFRPAVSLNNRTNEFDFKFSQNRQNNKWPLWAHSCILSSAPVGAQSIFTSIP
jgi:hypothetical protein